MATKAKKKKKSTPPNPKEQQENHVTQIVLDSEFVTAQENNQSRISDFESIIDMFEGERTEKRADWMSDISIPEFSSEMLAQSSSDAAQYFATKDFVETYLSDGSPTAVLQAESAKELINRTLNMRHLAYYQKYMRGRTSNNFQGYVYARTWWEQKTRTIKVPDVELVVDDTTDVFGGPITDPGVQEPRRIPVPTERDQEEVLVDRFNFDILDPRNVFTDNRYAYSIQEKEWVIIRYDRTLQELKDDAEDMEYFNLDRLEEVQPSDESETARKTSNEDDRDTPVAKSPFKKFDILERFGKFWSKVTKDEDGMITKAEIGLDKDGEIMNGAELVEVIITHAVSRNTKMLIGYKLTPYIDATGTPYKPLLRGLLYIHPTRDHGIGDGKFSRELQIALDDTFNISQDRTILATLPVLKGKGSAIEDNTTINFSPLNVMELDDPSDLEEFKINSDIGGALNQIAMLTGSMQKVTSVGPPDLGQVPEEASTSATAFAGAAAKSNMRSNYKSLTWEFTFLIELYWQILQMTWGFAREETARNLMGDKAINFNPSGDYTYKPLSQSIETESSKTMKRKEIIQVIGFIGQSDNPKAAAVVNMLLVKLMKLMGDEFEDVTELLDEDAPVNSGAGSPGEVKNPLQNQTRLPQSAAEQAVRG